MTETPNTSIRRCLAITDWCPTCNTNTSQELDGIAATVACTICGWEANVTDAYVQRMLSE